MNAAGDWGEPALSLVLWSVPATPTAAADLLIQSLGKGSKARVGYISNLLTAELTQEANIFESLVKGAGLTYVGRVNYNGSDADALSRYTSFVLANHADGMWFGDGLGPSIVDALVAASPSTKLVLRGLGTSGLQAVKQGKVLGTVDRNEYEEEFWSFVMLFMAAKYNITPPENVDLVIHTVTKENVDGFIAHPAWGGKTVQWV